MTHDSQETLNRLETLRGLRISIWEGSYATIWLILTGGAFLTGFALWLGANNFEIGLLTAIPMISGLVQVIAAYQGEKQASRRPFVSRFSLIGRLLWLPILLLPFLFAHSAAVPVFLILYAVSFVLVNIPIPAWTAWMADLVPADFRGRYFGKRNMVAGVVAMAVGLPAAWFLDYETRNGRNEAIGFGILFGFGVIGAILSYAAIMRQPEPPRAKLQEEPGSHGLRGLAGYYLVPFADKNFRGFLAFSALFSIGQYVAAPFFNVYALQVLRLNYVWMQIIAAVITISSLASMPLWGYLADRFGNKPLLVLSVFGVVTLPLSWLFTSRSLPMLTFVMLAENSITSGLFWSGVVLTQFNILIGSAPRERSSLYVATFAGVTGVIGGVSPLIGGILMNLLQGWHLNLYHLTFINFHILFIIAAVIRFFSLFLLTPLSDPGSLSTKDVLQELGRTSPRQWRSIRRLQRAEEPEERLKAAEALSETKSRLAVDELRLALTDPSQKVRSEAVRALGEIGDISVLDAIIEALRDPAGGVTAEAAEALGKLGDRRANGALISLVHNSQGGSGHLEKQSIIRALGRLGGADAVDALLGELNMSKEEELQAALAEALGKAGAPKAVPLLMQKLNEGNPAVSVRRSIIRALGDIGDPASIPALHEQFTETESDPALLPLLADALARLEDSEAIWLIIPKLASIISPVARRQTVHSAGRMLQVGDCAYSLLSQEPMDRETLVSKWIIDIQRSAPSSSSTMKQALTAWTQGDISKFLIDLHRAITRDNIQNIKNPLRESRIRFLKEAASLPPESASLETALLALCTLRSLLIGVQ